MTPRDAMELSAQEGQLLDGYLSGWVLRMASLPDGSKARETERAFFKKGWAS